MIFPGFAGVFLKTEERENYMNKKQIGATMFVSCGVVPAGWCAGSMPSEQWNIILFMVDDMGVNDTSVPFLKNGSELNSYYKTPNMEKLARKGVRFTRAYACPVSSPSRVSLMTGVNAARHKVTNWTLEPDRSTDAFPRDGRLAAEPWNWNGISPGSEGGETADNAYEATCFPRLLQKNGYKTIHIGKAHWGAVGTPGADPLNLGFNVNIGGCAAGGLSSYTVPDDSHLYAFNKAGDYPFPGLNRYARESEGYHITDAITRAALSEIETAVGEGSPFYLYVSHYAVHTPHEYDSRFGELYRGKNRKYGTLVSGMDRSLGKIMDYLDASGIADRTILIFMSDNGGHHSTSNLPLSGSKGSVFEGGIREPMMVYWPGVTDSNAGGINETPVIIEDFYPSILEMAGIAPGSYEKDLRQKVIDGKSFVPALKENSTVHSDRMLVFHYPNWWGEEPAARRKMRVPVGSSASAVIRGDYKLIYFYDTGKTDLYSLADDEYEKRPVSNPSLETVLASALSGFLKECGATMVYDRESGVITYPDGTVACTETAAGRQTPEKK